MRRWILLVGHDAQSTTFLEIIFENAGFHVIAADDERQGILQAREFKPEALVSERPFRDEAALDGVPIFLTSKPLDEVKIMSQVLALIERRKKTISPAPGPPPAPVSIASPAPAAPPIKKAPKRWLLLISSDPSTPTIVEMAILGMGLEVGTVGDAEHIIPRARTLRPQLIICDLDLPGLEIGSGILRDLRENPDMSAVPFIFISGFDKPLTPAADPSAHFLTKPLDLLKLQALIGRQLMGAGSDLPEPAGGTELKRQLVLILDGDPAVRAVLDRALVDMGFTTAAGDAAHAVGQACDLKPALIIADLQAAGAVDLLREMRLDALLLGIPLLFIADLPAEKAAGMLPWGDPSVRYMKKPLDLKKLKVLVKELTDQANEGAI